MQRVPNMTARFVETSSVPSNNWLFVLPRRGARWLLHGTSPHTEAPPEFLTKARSCSRRESLTCERRARGRHGLPNLPHPRLHSGPYVLSTWRYPSLAKLLQESVCGGEPAKPCCRERLLCVNKWSSRSLAVFFLCAHDASPRQKNIS